MKIRKVSQVIEESKNNILSTRTVNDFKATKPKMQVLNVYLQELLKNDLASRIIELENQLKNK